MPRTTLAKLLAPLFVLAILCDASPRSEDWSWKPLRKPKPNVTILTNAASATGTNSSDTLIQDGKLLFEMGKLQESEAKLRAALQLNLNDKQAAYYLRQIEDWKQRRSTNWSTGFDQLIYPTLPMRRVKDRPQSPEPSGLLVSGEAPSVHTSPAKTAILQKLQSIRLPSVRWENVPMSRALEELSEAVKQKDPEQHGIVFRSRSTNSEPTIRLTLRNVRAADVVDAISKVSDVPLTYSIEDTGVVFKDRGPVPKLYNRTFKVDPTNLMDALKQLGYPRAGSPPTFSHDVRGVLRTNLSPVPSVVMRDYLLAGGVDLTPPKYLFISERRGQLLVRGTLEDLERAAKSIEALHVEPSNVLIEVRAVEMDDTAEKKVGLDRLLTEDQDWSDAVTGVMNEDEYRTLVRALKAEKKAQVFTGKRTTTASGDLAHLSDFGLTNTVKGVTLLQHLSAYLTSHVTNLTVPVIMVDVLPIVRRDKFSIDLRIIPTITELLTMDPSNNATIPVAHARTRDRVEDITVWDGQTVVFSRVAKSTNYLTLFVTVSMVDSAGKRVHTDEEMRDARTTGVPGATTNSTDVHATVGKEEILRKLKTMYLPQISFDHLPLTIALEQLSKATKERDPEKKGIVFASCSTNSNVTVGLSLRNVTVADVVEAILNVTESQLRYSIEERGVVFSEASLQPRLQLFEQSFRIDPEKLTNALASVAWSTFHDSTTATLKDYLGVDLAPPRFLVMNDTGGIVVRATKAELRTISEELSIMMNPPPTTTPLSK